jgi:cytochrome P450
MGKAPAGWSPTTRTCEPSPPIGSFSRAALIGADYPRITPASIAQPEAINLMDPPVLNRLRHLVAAAFTTARVEKLRPFTRQRAEHLADIIAERGQRPTSWKVWPTACR